MYYAFAVVAAILVVALVVLYVLREQTGFFRQHVQIDEELHSDRTPTLAYEVPNGQDPALVLAALNQAGYTTTSDATQPHQTVLIACPGGVEGERPRIREVIEAAHVTAPHDGVPVPTPVRFVDE